MGDPPDTCKRPYSLGKRLESSDRKRMVVLDAARRQLEREGFLELSMESVAAEARVTRQTVYNLFGTKAGLIETLFDKIAAEGGMTRMSEVMRFSNPWEMLSGFVDIFCGFWSKNRLLLRRVHGLAAIDPEFSVAVTARNLRRHRAATRIVNLIARQIGRPLRADDVATLVALTSFEFYDVLAGESDGEQAIHRIQELAAAQFPERTAQ
jgi:AcrR family transcriptional regulator